jgi:hypothetical protein
MGKWSSTIVIATFAEVLRYQPPNLSESLTPQGYRR